MLSFPYVSRVVLSPKIRFHPRALHLRATTPKMATIIQSVKNTVAENFGGPAHSLAKPEHQFSIEEVPDQSGKVAVITGGSEGIGYGCSHTLLSRNIKKLFILSLSKEVVEKASDAVAEEMGKEAADKIVWLQCDLTDWKQTMETAEKIKQQTDQIDILINNAARGVMTYKLSQNGVDEHMALNHFGHAVLTSHLLPVLKKTASGGSKVRIVNLASNAHEMAPKDTKFASLDELNQDLGPNGQYGRSKLADLLYARYLAKHLKSSHPNILVNATHPGFVETRQSTEHIHEAFPLAGYGMSVVMNPFKKDNIMGATSTLFAATATEKSGEYICPPAIPEPGSELANDEALGEQLMKLAREIISEKTEPDSVAKGCPFKDY